MSHPVRGQRAALLRPPRAGGHHYHYYHHHYNYYLLRQPEHAAYPTAHHQLRSLRLQLQQLQQVRDTLFEYSILFIRPLHIFI